MTYSKLRFSKFKKFVSRPVFMELRPKKIIIEFSNFLVQLINYRSGTKTVCRFYIIVILKEIMSDMVKHELRVETIKARVESLKVRVQIQRCEFKTASYEFKSTGYKSKSTSYKFRSTEFKSTSYEFKSVSYEFKSTSYEFKSTSCVRV